MQYKTLLALPLNLTLASRLGVDRKGVGLRV